MQYDTRNPSMGGDSCDGDICMIHPRQAEHNGISLEPPKSDHPNQMILSSMNVQGNLQPRVDLFLWPRGVAESHT